MWLKAHKCSFWNSRRALLSRKLTRAAVRIAGGIGITSFRSLLRRAAHTQSVQEMILLFSSRRPGNTAFWPNCKACSKSLRAFVCLRP